MAKKKDDNGKKGGKKKPVYNAKKKYDALNHRLDNYTGAVDALYESLEEDMANIALRTGHHTLQEASMFRLASYPAAFQSFKKLVNTYLADLSFIIGRGTEMEWQRAETDHDNMVKDIMAQYGGKVPTRKLEGYLTHKTDAAEAFLSQQRDGKHGWSARVWNLTDQIQDEMELSVSAAVADGTSASTLAAQMKKYLNEPDRLFRRVRNEYGELELSKNAAAYHPGPGIYRSSRANAMRLCRSEINMAYRNADQERYQSEDFVVGYEINLSGSHPEHDICDILKGKYPKNFQWSGWHPNDLCFITPILKTEEDFFSLEDTTPKNQVDDVPEAYKKYLEDNAERLEAARQRGTLPFWVKDNYQIGKNGGYRPLFGPDAGPRSVVSETKTITGAGTRNEGQTEGLLDIFRKDVQISEEMMRKEIEMSPFSMEQNDNHRHVEDFIGIPRGERMTFKNADNGAANPGYLRSFGIEDPRHQNCTLCVAAHEMRVRGWNVYAIAMDDKNAIAQKMMKEDGFRMWLNPNGTKAVPSKIRKNQGLQKVRNNIDELSAAPGRYHVSAYYIDDDGNKMGHIVCLDRLPDNTIRIYDPQSGDRYGFNELFAGMTDREEVNIMRVDDKLINPIIARAIIRPN